MPLSCVTLVHPAKAARGNETLFGWDTPVIPTSPVTMYYIGAPVPYREGRFSQFAVVPPAAYRQIISSVLCFNATVSAELKIVKLL